MGFLKKLGGAALGTAGALALGYGAYKVASDNPDQAIASAQVAMEAYESTEDIYDTAGHFMMESYLQNQEYNENYLRNLGISAVGAAFWATATYSLSDIDQVLEGNEPEE